MGLLFFLKNKGMVGQKSVERTNFLRCNFITSESQERALGEASQGPRRPGLQNLLSAHKKSVFYQGQVSGSL